MGAKETQNPLRVLIVFEEGPDHITFDLIEEGIETTLLAGITRPVEFYHEFLDASRFREAGHHKLFEDYLKVKYGVMGIDLFIPIIGTRVDWASHIPRKLFPDVPIVFGSLVSIPLVSEMTGVQLNIDVVKGLETALSVRPRTKRVIVVAGTDSRIHSRLITSLATVNASHPEIEFEYWTDRTAAQILESAAFLPDDSLVFYIDFYRDSEGAAFIPWQFGRSLAKVASSPVFGIYESYLDTGVVGGAVVGFSSLGVEIARLALRVLNGERASAIPVMNTPGAVLMFDWRAMQRWGIAEADLPDGSIVRFRPPPLWETHRLLLVIGSLWTIVLLIVILALVLTRQRRSLAEKKLQQNEERLRLALELSGAGIWVLNLKTEQFLLTERTLMMFGFLPDEKIDLKRFFEAVHPNDRELLRRVFDETITSEESGRVEYRIVLPGGSVRWIISQGRAHSTSSSPDFLMGVSLDISDIRNALKQAQHDRNALAHVSRVSTMSELATSLAHELNQPLNAILNNAQAGQRFLRKENPDLEEIEEIFIDIVTDDKRASDIIQRMRAFLRKDSPQSELLNINEVIGDVLKILHTEVIIQGMLVRTDLAVGLPCVLCDRVQLEQVFVNLVVNAEQAMNCDQTTPCTLFIRTFKDSEDLIVVYIEDKGKGIAENMLEKIFDPFHTTKVGSLGMGLSISRTIVEANKGRIWAENLPESGTRFCVALPNGEMT